jgi:hypothetical protein
MHPTQQHCSWSEAGTLGWASVLLPEARPYFVP